MFWWVVLGYVVLSPILGVLVGTAIRMQGSGMRTPRVEKSSATEPCPVPTGVGGQLLQVAASG